MKTVITHKKVNGVIRIEVEILNYPTRPNVNDPINSYFEKFKRWMLN